MPSEISTLWPFEPGYLNLFFLDSELSLAFVFLSLWGCRLRIFSVFYPLLATRKVLL